MEIRSRRCHLKRLAVITGSRAEYGQLRPFLRLARESSAFDLKLIVAGMHFSSVHGRSVYEIKADGFPIAAQVPMVVRDNSSKETAKALGRGVCEFAGVFDKLEPDLILVEGDRVEALAATLAAAYMGIPICHGGGGDVTTTIDNAARHSISHFASLHFVSHEQARERLIRMGCSALDIHVTGGLGIDAIMQHTFRTREETLADLGLPPDSRYLLVAFHPETGHESEAGQWMGNILKACLGTGLNLVVTYPNSDPGSEAIIAQIREHESPSGDGWVTTARAFPSLGSDRYLDALKHADALVGNSSSGLYEAPTLRVPVVNVGHRQDGRIKASNIMDADYSQDAISSELALVLMPYFREVIAAGAVSPYGDGHAAERMMAIIEGRLGG